MSDTNPDILTAAMISTRTGFSEAKIRRMMLSGDMPGRKIGGRFVCSRIAFEAWLADGLPSACPKPAVPQRGQSTAVHSPRPAMRPDILARFRAAAERGRKRALAGD